MKKRQNRNVHRRNKLKLRRKRSNPEVVILSGPSRPYVSHTRPAGLFIDAFSAPLERAANTRMQDPDARAKEEALGAAPKRRRTNAHAAEVAVFSSRAVYSFRKSRSRVGQCCRTDLECIGSLNLRSVFPLIYCVLSFTASSQRVLRISVRIASGKRHWHGPSFPSSRPRRTICLRRYLDGFCLLHSGLLISTS